MSQEDFYTEIEQDWGLEENKDMYLGFSTTAVPETIQSGKEVFYPEAESVWNIITAHGLDKVAHFGFSYFGSRAVMNAVETFPEYTKQITEDREDILSEKAYYVGTKLSDPSFQQKAGVALLGVAVLGFGKEMSDTYIDYLDMTANMTGGSLGVLQEYGEGSIKDGGKKAFQEINKILSGEQEITHIPDAETAKISEKVIKKQELLGKA